MPEQKKLIQFKNIVKSFEDGQVVLKGVSLDIYENEFVTLLGPSGCGKTTLLRILGGFLQPTEGKVLFDGEEHPLRRGETFYLHGRRFHLLKNVHKTTARVLWVSTPPLF